MKEPFINIIWLPTSFRFRKAKEAKNWGSNTKSWHIIHDIVFQGEGFVSIATNEFAWIDKEIKDIGKDLEFKYNQIDLPGPSEDSCDDDE